MSSYNLAINWVGKDALSDSDPDKVVSGSDLNTEFNTIKTAVNTKADLNGSASESFSASTPTAGDNTTKVATTAFVTTALEAVYPVGSVYISTVSTNPNTLFGFGTWTAFGAGKTLVGIDSGDTDFDTVEETGGAKTHTLTLSEIPSHTHTVHEHGVTGGESLAHGASWGYTSQESGAAGGGGAHNNLQPYIVTYMWKRTV